MATMMLFHSVAAIVCGKASVDITSHTANAVFTQRNIMSLVNRLLPQGRDRQARPGHESVSAWAPSPLTKLADEAATMNNER